MDVDVPIEVTPLMAVWVNDQLQCPTDEDGRALHHAVMLKLFGLIGGQQAMEVRFSKDELWMLQTVAKSAATIGSEKVGWQWMTDIAEGLLHLEDQDAVHQAVMRHGEQAGDPEEGRETRRRMADWPGRAERHDG